MPAGRDSDTWMAESLDFLSMLNSSKLGLGEGGEAAAAAAAGPADAAAAEQGPPAVNQRNVVDLSSKVCLLLWNP